MAPKAPVRAPGPEWPRAAQMAAWYTRPMATMRYCSDRYGSTFRLRIGHSTDGVFVTAHFGLGLPGRFGDRLRVT